MKKTRSAILRAVFGFATFGLLFLVLHPSEILAALADAHLGYFAAGFALCVAAIGARAYRWQLILRHMDLRISFWRLFEVYTISYWFNTFMLGGMGGDLYKVYDISQASAKKIRPAVSVITERATGVLALLMVAIAALAIFHDRVPVPPWILAILLAGTTLLTLALLMAVLWLDRIWPPIARVAPFLRKLFPDDTACSIGEVCREMRGNRRLFVEAMGLGFVIQALVMVGYYVLALSVSQSIDSLYFFTLYPLVEVASLAPITINGMGLREGLIVASLKYEEMGPALAMSLGIIFRIASILLALLGGLLLMLRKKGWRTGGNPEAGASPGPG